jgi:hypothetical protein
MLNCSICEKQISVTRSGWAEGNNAEPANSGRCCDACNESIVLPARMDALHTWSKEDLIRADFGVNEILIANAKGGA